MVEDESLQTSSTSRSDAGQRRQVAPDAWPTIAAFRAAGSVSFQDVGVVQARENYEASCEANGIARKDMKSVRDITVDPATGMGVRIYDPGSLRRPARAGVLFIHGGGWVIGSLKTHDRLCRALAARSGAVVTAVGYRLAPEHVYPAAIDDCRHALRWFVQNAESLGVDPSRIGVVGDSAGGQLAAVLANESATGYLPKLRSQALLYPVTDVSMSTPSYGRVSAGFPLTNRTMKWFIDLYMPDEKRRGEAAASPLRHPLPAQVPPSLIVTVEHDPLSDEGIRYAASLSEAGVSTELHHLPGYAHGLFTTAGRIVRGDKELDRVAEFVRRTTTE